MGREIFQALRDSRTGYNVDFIIYLGATTKTKDPNRLGKFGAVVSTLMELYLQKGIIYAQIIGTPVPLFAHTFTLKALVFVALQNWTEKECQSFQRGEKQQPEKQTICLLWNTQIEGKSTCCLWTWKSWMVEWVCRYVTFEQRKQSQSELVIAQMLLRNPAENYALFFFSITGSPKLNQRAQLPWNMYPSQNKLLRNLPTYCWRYIAHHSTLSMSPC